MDELDVRLKIEKEVYSWCKSNGIAAGVMGTIRALNALGYIDLASQPIAPADGIICCALCGCEIEPSTVICRDCRGGP